MLVELTLDGQEQGIGKCIQPYWSKKNFPVNDLSSKDLMCRSSDMNWSSETACPVAAGSQVSVEWNRNKQGTADVISASHTGPCIVYMAAAESKGEGNVWFKIFEEGYDSSSKKWCTDKLIANKGKLDIAIPGDIKAGSYFLRTEIVALHGARRVGQCQFYPNCAQLEVTGGGSAVPDGVALPGYYKSDDPAGSMRQEEIFKVIQIQEKTQEK
ncbi:hypothetical protein LPJ76_005232 [Coemansia sp. RSA 638]|nr:hypothetical protein LPJ76_005232 [Coemansia sp. RSA 638]